MKRVGTSLIVIAVIVCTLSIQGFAEWQTNTDFPLIGDPNAQKGGEFRYAMMSYPSTFRVHGPGSATSLNFLISNLVYQTLVSVHPSTLEFIPRLAEAWEIQEDNQTFLFRLNPNARWADGQPVTPQDVVFSWEHAVDPNTQDPYLTELFGSRFEKPEIVDEHTVKFVARDLHWNNFLFCGASLEILPAHIYQGKDYVEDFNWDVPNGSGPYRLADFRKGNTIVLERRDDFWAWNEYGYQGLYNFDRIKFLVVRDQNLMFEKFKKGELDYYYVNIAREWVEETDFDKVQQGWIQKRKIYTNNPNGVYGLALNMRIPPLDDVRVRKALAYLYNREIFMEKLFFNEYQSMHSYYPGSVYENPDNEPISYNPEKAIALLEEAGWSERNNQGVLVKDGHPFQLSILYSSKSSERYLTIYQEDLRKAGIELNLKLLDHMALFKLLNERKYEMAVMAWTGLRFPNPESAYHSNIADIDNTNNITGVKNPDIDAILDEYPTMFDINDRIAAIQELDALLYQEHPYILNWYGPFERILYWNKFGMPESYLTKTGDYDDMLLLWWHDPEQTQALEEAMESGTALPVGEVDVDYWGAKSN